MPTAPPLPSGRPAVDMQSYLQDVRGRFASDGDWYPFQHEFDDGYDTVEWAGGPSRTQTAKWECSDGRTWVSLSYSQRSPNLLISFPCSRWSQLATSITNGHIAAGHSSSSSISRGHRSGSLRTH